LTALSLVKAYIFDRQDVDARGEVYDRYRPCEMCHGSGNQVKWVNLEEFAHLLDEQPHLSLIMLLLHKSNPLISIRVAEISLGNDTRFKHHLDP